MKIKTILEVINRRLGDIEHTCNLEDGVMEISQSEQQKENQLNIRIV